MSQVAFPTKTHKNSTIHHLVVRPINIAERSQWDTLMVKHHYLGIKSLVGKSIRYAAEIQGQWIALEINRGFWCGSSLLTGTSSIVKIVTKLKPQKTLFFYKL